MNSRQMARQELFKGHGDLNCHEQSLIFNAAAASDSPLQLAPQPLAVVMGFAGT
jgi:hypothetical protein